MLDSTENSSIEKEPNQVQLVDASGEWFVRVIEHGQETRLKSFDRKRSAVAYAEAERERLGLAKVTRI